MRLCIVTSHTSLLKCIVCNNATFKRSYLTVNFYFLHFAHRFMSFVYDENWLKLLEKENKLRRVECFDF